MRLIDADAFIEYLGLDADDAREINLGGVVSLEDFDRQPTTYDVDKVVEQLESVSIPENKVLYASPDEFAQFVKLKDAVEIVKSGGIK